MEFLIHDHRFALEISNSVPEMRDLWHEVANALESISEEELIAHFEANYQGSSKSISKSINDLIKDRLIACGWNSEAALFAEPGYRGSGGRWRLDFSKSVLIEDPTLGEDDSTRLGGMAIEIAFNHGEAIAWNLLKPVIASELNHVPQETQIGQGIGVVIAATAEMKNAGGFDGAVGEYEKFLQYLKPMRNFLTIPMLVVGLQAPETFRVRLVNEGTRKIGVIERL